MLTRRRLLAALAAASAASAARLASVAEPAQFFPHRRKGPPLPQPLVFIGTDTARPNAKGVYLCRFDPNKGQLSAPVLAAPTLRASFLAHNEIAGLTVPKTKLHPQTQAEARHLIYVCNEGDAKTSAISSYALNPITGALTPLGQVSAGGEGPCYISVDASGRSAYVANYAGGTVASFQVKQDGSLSEPVSRVDFHNAAVFGHHGPNKARQDGPHPHSATLSPDNRFILVNDLGDDEIAIFPIDPASARLGKPHLFQNIPPGSGPRHIAFHPNGRWAYGIDELANRLDQYLYTAMHQAVGQVEAQAVLANAGHSVSTIDAGFHGVNTAAEVMVVPTGDHLYASNRGEDSLVVFTIDETTGNLTFRQRISCGGKTPRHFTLDHSGDWILCGNQDSASITVFARDAGSGRLSGPVQTLPIESPMYTLFV
jgi:6-phosphogluconolactonase